MHGAWGALTTLIRKQELTKNRKAKLRHELRKRRENLISKDNKEMIFNEVSNSDLIKIKAQIRKKYRIEKVKNTLVNVLLILVSFSIVYYIYTIIIKASKY